MHFTITTLFFLLSSSTLTASHARDGEQGEQQNCVHCNEVFDADAFAVRSNQFQYGGEGEEEGAAGNGDDDMAARDLRVWVLPCGHNVHQGCAVQIIVHGQVIECPHCHRNFERYIRQDNQHIRIQFARALAEREERIQQGLEAWQRFINRIKKSSLTAYLPRVICHALGMAAFFQAEEKSMLVMPFVNSLQSGLKYSLFTCMHLMEKLSPRFENLHLVLSRRQDLKNLDRLAFWLTVLWVLFQGLLDFEAVEALLDDPMALGSLVFSVLPGTVETGADIYHSVRESADAQGNRCKSCIQRFFDYMFCFRSRNVQIVVDNLHEE